MLKKLACALLLFTFIAQAGNKNTKLKSQKHKINTKTVKTLISQIKKLPLAPSCDHPKAQQFTLKDLVTTAEKFIKTRKAVLSQALWLKTGTKDYYFTHKYIAPEDSEFEIRGDLHGDVHSLLNWIDDLIDKKWIDSKNPFKIIKKNAHLVFLGDYTDRGHYGAEIIFIILQLYLHNPNQVVLIRGNHESLSCANKYGFEYELNEKFSKEVNDKARFTDGFNQELSEEIRDKVLSPIMDAYNLMPVAVFLGCKNDKNIDFIQLCHGGMSPGYDYRPLLDETEGDNVYEWINKEIDQNWKLRIQNACKITKNDVIKKKLSDFYQKQNKKHGDYAKYNGFQWSDFDFFNGNPDQCIYQQSGLIRYTITQLYTTDILQTSSQKNRLWAVLRAHQHDEETIPALIKNGNGIYKSWPSPEKQWDGKSEIKIKKNSVWTFNVAPRTGNYEYSNISPKKFNFDTVGWLLLKKNFKNWSFKPRKIYVEKNQ